MVRVFIYLFIIGMLSLSIFFTHIEMAPLPVKGYNFYLYFAFMVIKQCGSVTTCIVALTHIVVRDNLYRTKLSLSHSSIFCCRDQMLILHLFSMATLHANVCLIYYRNTLLNFLKYYFETVEILLYYILCERERKKTREREV